MVNFEAQWFHANLLRWYKSINKNLKFDYYGHKSYKVLIRTQRKQ